MIPVQVSSKGKNRHGDGKIRNPIIPVSASKRAPTMKTDGLNPTPYSKRPEKKKIPPSASVVNSARKKSALNVRLKREAPARVNATGSISDETMNSIPIATPKAVAM